MMTPAMMAERTTGALQVGDQGVYSKDDRRRQIGEFRRHLQQSEGNEEKQCHEAHVQAADYERVSQSGATKVFSHLGWDALLVTEQHAL